MSATENSTDGLLEFSDVLKQEIESGCRPPGKSMGLAFSGGGIRSATFNLGVVQALAELKLLQRFDYLSTISGGGYIGGWLSTFIRRQAEKDVARAEEELQKRPDALEHSAIRFLRTFSNYLTPRMGLSADTFTAIATYLRNLLLTLSILVLILGAALLIPRIAVLAGGNLAAWGGFDTPFLFELILVTLLIVATCLVAMNLLYRPPSAQWRWPWYTRSRYLLWLIDVPVAIAASVAACYYVHVAKAGISLSAWPWIVSVTVVYVVLWGVGLLVALMALPADSRVTLTRLEKSRRSFWWVTAFVFFAIAAGALGGSILYGISRAIARLPNDLWAVAALGPPAIVGAFLLMMVMHVGLMGRKFTEGDRELWSALGGRLLALAVAWPIVFVIALYGPAALATVDQWVAGAGGLAWVATTLFGILAGHSDATGKRDAKPWVEILTRIAPYVFVLGLLIALSWGVHNALAWSHDAVVDKTKGAVAAETAPPAAPEVAAPGIYLRASGKADTPVVTVREIEAPSLGKRFLANARAEYPRLKTWIDPWWVLPSILAAALAIAALLAWRININLFSLHHFYRNRLTRCYLGATNTGRRPHPLTGFDPADDVMLADLVGQKPLHIVGTAINLNRGKQLAWQSRRAASFAFTPLHVGYEPASLQARGGYRMTREYGKDSDGISIQLGTAVAISGAAASPNQGFHTSPVVAFMMTVFSVRLGHWCGNTASKQAWMWRDPLFSLRYWWAELTGSADQESPFVNLSDGGHFENLGVYELVRRRCGLILASDAGADPKYAFDDLAEAMRKCYTDFGVKFEFTTPVEDIRPAAEDKPSTRHYAIANIVYPEGQVPGTLVYWKSSLSADLPPDIMHYRRTHGDFPHETTADQFFDESQFESYRHLGYEVALRSIAEMRKRNELPGLLS